jgi:hypothetical protein
MEHERQGEGQHPNPQGQNIPGSTRPEEDRETREVATPVTTESPDTTLGDPGPRPEGGGDAGGEGTGQPQSGGAPEATTEDLQESAHRHDRSTQS